MTGNIVHFTYKLIRKKFIKFISPPAVHGFFTFWSQDLTWVQYNHQKLLLQSSAKVFQLSTPPLDTSYCYLCQKQRLQCNLPLHHLGCGQRIWRQTNWALGCTVEQNCCFADRRRSLVPQYTEGQRV